MERIRVIPSLLLSNGGLVKTTKFSKPAYVGDPINAVKIFNEKEVDELVVLDISAARLHSPPNFDAIAKLATECFMPLAYGGGISSISHIRTLFKGGVEKVILNSCIHKQPGMLKQAVGEFGSQSIVASIDAKKDLFGRYRVKINGGTKWTKHTPHYLAQYAVSLGAGEIFLNSIDRDGTMSGYDLNLIELVTKSVPVPVIACGGASSIKDFALAVAVGGAAAVSAGSMFVFHGPHKAVLINYPDEAKLKKELFSCRSPL
jgi:cyclase